MSHNPAVDSNPHRRRRWIPSATTLGAGGTALVIWFEELIVLAAEIISIIFLVILSLPIFVFNYLVFKSAMSRPGDMGRK